MKVERKRERKESLKERRKEEKSPLSRFVTVKYDSSTAETQFPIIPFSLYLLPCHH